MTAVGKIVGCFGVRGFLKVAPTSHIPDRLLKLTGVYVGTMANSGTRFEIESAEKRSSNVILKLRNVSDRTEAEKFIGSFLFIDDSEVITPSKGSYLVHEIIGCEVWQKETLIGHVEEVYALPAQDVWVVRNGMKLHLIPAVKEFIKHVDLKKKKIRIESIEGLLE